MHLDHPPTEDYAGNNFPIGLSHLSHLGESQKPYISSERYIIEGFHARNDHLFPLSLDTKWQGTDQTPTTAVRQESYNLKARALDHTYRVSDLTQSTLRKASHETNPTSYRRSLTANQFHMEPKHEDIVDDVLIQMCRLAQFYKIFPWPFSANWPKSFVRSQDTRQKLEAHPNHRRADLRWGGKEHHGEYKVTPSEIAWFRDNGGLHKASWFNVISGGLYALGEVRGGQHYSIPVIIMMKPQQRRSKV